MNNTEEANIPIMVEEYCFDEDVENSELACHKAFRDRILRCPSQFHTIYTIIIPGARLQ
jgi:hypothetical protein